LTSSGEPHKREIVVAPRTVWIVLGNTVAAVAALWLLWSLRTVVSWVLVSLLVALALEPAVAALHRRGMRRGWAVLLALLVVVLFVGTLVGTLVPVLVTQARALVAHGPELLERIRSAPIIEWADRRFGIVADMQAMWREKGTELAAPALSAARDVLHGLLAALTVIVLTVFMLLFGGEVFAAAVLWLSPESQVRCRDLALRMRKMVGGFVAGSIFVALIGGTVMGATTAILRVPFFLPLGLVMVVLGVIPFLGSAIGALLVVGVTFATTGLREAIIVGVVFAAYQQLENHVLQPLVQRRTMRMNPLIIALAVLTGTALAGILGALLALPLAGSIQVLLLDAQRRKTADPC
jgi:predicted PurR-regulated permease PerM